MQTLKKESLKSFQDGIYADRNRWESSAVIKPASRLSIVLRYARILQLYGLLQDDDIEGRLKILELGCGIGSLSDILTHLGTVTGFDNSTEGIKVAKKLFGQNMKINFFEADGTNPNLTPELKDKKFDLVLLREFYPFTRNIIDNPKPIDLLKEYYKLLNDGGLIIIEHGLLAKAWNQEEMLQTKKIVKYFHAKIFNTMALDLSLALMRGFRRKWFLKPLTKLIEPFIAFLCRMKKIRISKTIIIKR